MNKISPTLLLVAGLAAIVPSERALRQAREVSSPTSSETAWVRYVMVGLGGFRGLISEILWIRADRLQQQGRFFELAQLADWITSLDPRATDSWIFNSWNLAYNVSALIPDHNSRVPWVFAGINLLKDRAIPANPRNPALYCELGFNYQFKIGGNLDPAADAYKIELAKRYASKDAAPKIPEDLSKETRETLASLDYRIAESHSLYWAALALRLEPEGFNRVAAIRMMEQSLFTLLTKGGRFTGETDASLYSAEPAFNLLPYYMFFSDNALRQYPERIETHMLSLREIALVLAKNGRETQSRTVYMRLCELMKSQQLPIPTYQEIVLGEHNNDAPVN